MQGHARGQRTRGNGPCRRYPVGTVWTSDPFLNGDLPPARVGKGTGVKARANRQSVRAEAAALEAAMNVEAAVWMEAAGQKVVPWVQ